MKPYGIALAVTCGVGVVLFAIIYFVSNDPHIAEAVGALPIVASHNVAEMLERRETRARVAAGGATSVETLKAFVITWPIILGYGTVTIFAAHFIANAFAGAAVDLSIAAAQSTDAVLVAGTLTSITAQFIAHTFVGVAVGFSASAAPVKSMTAVLVGATPLKLVAGFLLGRWIGARGGNGSLALVLAAALLGPLIELLADLGIVATIGGEEARARYQYDAFGDAGVWLISSAQFALAGLLGVWRGRARRLGDYMDYLLSVLPPESRGTLVDLAYDEAKRVTPDRNGRREMMHGR